MSTLQDRLSRRERQIMDIIFELSEATAKTVLERLPDPPSYSAVRALLANLERKKLVRHVERDLRYVYLPTTSAEEERESALSRLVRVFYHGSLSSAVNGMVEMGAARLSDNELKTLEDAIRRERQKRSK